MLTLHWSVQLNLNTDVTIKLTNIAEGTERHLRNKTGYNDRNNTISAIGQNMYGRRGLTCYKVGAENILCQIYNTVSFS